MNLLTRLQTHPDIEALIAAVGERGSDVTARGASGSSTALIAASVHQQTQQPTLIIVGHLDDADEIVDELASFDIAVTRFPALEVLPGESNVNPELQGERLHLARLLGSGQQPGMIVAPIQALMQGVPDDEELATMLRPLKVGDTIDLANLIDWMNAAGYERLPSIESPNQFAIRGSIVDIFSPGEQLPIRLDLFGDDIDAMWEIDLETMGSDRRIAQATLLSTQSHAPKSSDDATPLIDLLQDNTIAILQELMEINEQGRGYFERLTDATGIQPHTVVFKQVGNRCHARVQISQYISGPAADAALVLPIESSPSFSEETSEAVKELLDLAVDQDVLLLCQNEGEESRLRELIADHQANGDHERLHIQQHYLHRGFVLTAEGVDAAVDRRHLVVVPYHELLHRFHTRRRVRRIATGKVIETFLDIEPSDLVVHRDHGIGRFVSFGPLESRSTSKSAKRSKRDASEEEYLTLEFDGSAKLHVPASQIDAIQKYIGGFKGRPKLSKIGSNRWSKQKAEVAEAVRDLATDMLQIQAARQAMTGIRYPDDTNWQREFEAEFPYEETEDQLAAIAAVKRDMTSERPMDRLICGDVGFGKTEVAIRAAFKAAEFGKQVAVLVPTTVLAEQHEQTFRTRFADYPFRIESISRFKTKKEQATVLKEAAAGRVDILIGTHRLLSQDVSFKDLGLVIVDEEQRFGVEHKNRLLQLRLMCDVLTLSATPIPRTLHMSLLGLRDISSLTTAPADRRAIVTEVMPYDKQRVKRAMQRELAREGQIFFVHNRVHDIQSIADEVQQLVPDAKIVIGHGQMPPRQLENVMLKFMRRKADILVSTTIIESGIDIPTANTMIIHDADLFGLSDLHQLRGRVGRYKHRAYCYLLLPDDRTTTDTSVKRLRAIEEYSMLGAGFKIAMRDLEIRGAGNLLGAEQSGHISAVGYEMYCQLLHQAVDRLKNGTGTASASQPSCVVDLNITGSLTRHYIPSDQRRLEAYRRLADATTLEELDKAERDLTTAYGEPPKSAQRLIELAAIRVAAARLDVVSITHHEDDIVFKTKNPKALEDKLTGIMGSLRLVTQTGASGVRESERQTGMTEIYYRPPKSYLEPNTLLPLLRRRLVGRAS